jgi:WD40 repeat protein
MQWWLLMGDDEGSLRYLHSYDEIMKGKGVLQLPSLLLLPPSLPSPCNPAVHTRAVRDIAFSPTDAKFVTCSDDSGLKVFDFDRVRWLSGRYSSSSSVIRFLQAGTSIMEKQKTVACERLFDGHNVIALAHCAARAQSLMATCTPPCATQPDDLVLQDAVNSCDWHPWSSLIVSGSSDATVLQLPPFASPPLPAPQPFRLRSNCGMLALRRRVACS